MRPEVQRQILRRLQAARDGTPELPPRTTRFPTGRYTDPAALERERERIFRRAPLIVAHASELASPGDWRASSAAGAPLIAVRGPDRIRVFRNICRHRGAELLSGGGGCVKALVCPYHAWAYKLDGRLFHVPRRDVFAELDLEELSLQELPSAVRHGFVWAAIDPPETARSGEALSIERYLGPALDDDLTAFGLADYVALGRTDRTVAANWKLVMDAFTEGYHLRSLHRTSLSKFFLDLSVLDDLSPHLRQVGARRGFPRGDEPFDLHAHTTVFYDVFPNTVLVFHPAWLSHLQMCPVGVDRVQVIHRMLAPRDADAAALERSFHHIDRQVFEKEDLHIAASIQRAMNSGEVHEMILGSQEEGTRLFHANRDAWLERD